MVDTKWVETCATAGEFLYGFYPVSVLKKMYQTKKGYSISDDELINTVTNSDSVLMEYVEGKLVDFGNYGEGFFAPAELEDTPLAPMLEQARKEGNPYAELHLDDDARITLLASQEDVEFFIPEEKEIAELVEEGFIRTPAMAALEDKIRSMGGETGFLKGIWSRYSTDAIDQFEAINALMSGIFSIKGEAIAASMEDLNGMMPLVNEFLNNVNLRARRGWQPTALFKKLHPNGLTSMPTIMPGSVHAVKLMKAAEPQLRAMGTKVDYSSIDNFATVGPYGERRIVKVGRNDPCPCGSGKKYKFCHGR